MARCQGYWVPIISVTLVFTINQSWPVPVLLQPEINDTRLQGNYSTDTIHYSTQRIEGSLTDFVSNTKLQIPRKTVDL